MSGTTFPTSPHLFNEQQQQQKQGLKSIKKSIQDKPETIRLSENIPIKSTSMAQMQVRQQQHISIYFGQMFFKFRI